MCQKSNRIAFFSLPTVYFFTIFVGMSPQKVCQNDLVFGTKAYQSSSLTPTQFCSKDALNEAIFPKNSNFGTHAVAFFLSCFSHKTQILL